MRYTEITLESHHGLLQYRFQGQESYLIQLMLDELEMLGHVSNLLPLPE
jgi:hypothetical protein